MKTHFTFLAQIESLKNLNAFFVKRFIKLHLQYESNTLKGTNG